MAFLWTTALKDLRQRWADPVGLLIWIGIPIALGGLMGLLFGGPGGASPKAHVFLADEDDSLLSGFLAGAGSQQGVGELLSLELVDRVEGRRRLDRGEGTALLVIPEGFQDAVLSQEPAELTLVTNPAQRILPAILEEGLGMALEVIFYAQQLLAEPLQQIQAGPPPGESFFSDETISALSVDLNRRLEALEPVLFPPVIVVEGPPDLEDDESGSTQGLDFGQLFLPGILFMSILFIVQGMSNELWEERAKGTLRRVLCTPQSVAAFLAGKVLATVALVALISVVGLGVGALFFDLAVLHLPGALLWSTFAGGALFIYFLLLQLSSPSQRGANLASTIVVFPLMMLGGSFFPFEAMPAWMAAVGRLTPNGLAVVHLKAILFGQPEPIQLLIAGVAIGAPALVAFFVASRRLRTSFGAG